MVGTVAETTRWWAYVSEVTRGSRQKDIAHRIGIDPSHISRWAQRQRPNATFVVAFARAYGVNPLKALAEAEIINDAEADLREVRVGLNDFSTEQLLEEALQRVRSPA